MTASCVATAYTMRYGNAKTGVMFALESPVSVGGSIDLFPSASTTGSGRVPNASSPDEVSRVMCRTG